MEVLDTRLPHHEVFTFRADGTFDKHFEVNGNIERIIQNEKWAVDKRSLWLNFKNKPYYRVVFLTFDTLVLQVKGLEERWVYKKVK